jgi:hypothetical protein
VKCGDVIGLLGDTGVKNSAPHLHFAMTVRAVKDGPERYIDPEPLVALWPLWVPVDGSEVGLVTTIAEPGVPLGSATLRAGRGRRVAAKTVKRAASSTPPDDESGGGEDDAMASGAAGGEGETEPAPPSAASDSTSDSPTEE